jgi:hypothetical protein
MTPKDSMNKFSKLFFIIPTYHYFPGKALSDIVRLFNDAHIIIINDNPRLGIKENDHYTKIDNPKNLGLASTLDIGYSKALSMGADIVVKVDPDLEYPLKSIKPILDDLDAEITDAGFVHFSRNLRGISVFDYIFHILFGKLESSFIGSKISQHSPGLQVYRSSSLKNVLRSYRAEIENKNIRWGGDLLLLKLSKDHGLRVKGYEIHRFWPEKRKFSKILSQGINTIQIMIGYRGVR